jgi:transcriptional regulator with XRE-family HTH domain
MLQAAGGFSLRAGAHDDSSFLLYEFVMSMSSPAPAFAVLLKQARERQGLSQAQLAERAGLQPSAIAHFEADRRKPSFENVRRLAKALDVSSDLLLGVPAAMAFRNEDKLTKDDRDYVQGLINKLAGERRD